MRRKRCVLRRGAMAAWRLCARAPVIVAVAVVAGCDDESFVGPPPVAEPAALASVALSTAPMSDRDILIALYEATDGPGWLNSENWLTDAPLGEWHGVETDASGRVVGIHLGGTWDSEAREWVNHGLAGSIPAELGGLANLQSLSLGHNELSGPIPAELGGLANLESLNLADNELSGPIPPELGALANLRGLRLGDNQLSGTIPGELGALANLGTLWLNSNQLSGTIPPQLGDLVNVWQLGACAAGTSMQA